MYVCMYVCMYKCMYKQYIQGLCQSRLSTANHALLLISPATTAVYSLERYILARTAQRTASNSFSIVAWARCLVMALILLLAYEAVG
jgi:hypothetical protein